MIETCLYVCFGPLFIADLMPILQHQHPLKSLMNLWKQERDKNYAKKGHEGGGGGPFTCTWWNQNHPHIKISDCNFEATIIR